jgi:hypothetical protein
MYFGFRVLTPSIPFKADRAGDLGLKSPGTLMPEVSGIGPTGYRFFT